MGWVDTIVSEEDAAFVFSSEDHFLRLVSYQELTGRVLTAERIVPVYLED
jgi:hypothetical protein